MRPSRLLLPVIVLLSSSISDVNAEVIEEPSHDQRIEQEVKRYAVPSLVELLKKADAEGRVIPLESFSLTEPHRLLDAEILSRPAGHVHPALLDERYYNANTEVESVSDELRKRFNYLILDSEGRQRPEIALDFDVTDWDNYIYHFEYDDSGKLSSVRLYGIEDDVNAGFPKLPELREEFRYDTLGEREIAYTDIMLERGTRKRFRVAEYRSLDGGRTMESTWYSVMKSGRKSLWACEYSRTVDERPVYTRLNHGPLCGSFSKDRFVERERLFADFEKFIFYRFPDVRLDELIVEYTEFSGYQVTGARFWKNNTLLAEFKFRGYIDESPERCLSWQIRFSDVLIVAEKDRYFKNSYSQASVQATFISGTSRQEKLFTRSMIADIAGESSLRKAGLDRLHPLLEYYLVEWLKARESPPRQRRTYSVTVAQVKDLQRVINAAMPGDTIQLQAGVYRIDRPLKLKEKSYLTMRAVPDVEILVSDPYAPVFELIRSDHVQLIGFRARHEVLAMCSAAVIDIVSSRNIVLQHLELNGSGAYAVEISGSRDILIEHNYLHSNSNAAFRAWSSLENVVIRFNRIENNPQIFQYAFFPGAGEIEFYGNTGQSLIRQRCEKVKEKKGNRYHKCGSYQ
ncbi:MAG: hypothetical protein F9K24_14295 [Leptonema illini]|uniref:Right handed beta helix domain-containing protein n=1 Tax=Leptonema illini TaxID=183 RepID=A0A833LWB0_9LEPT|nr:MAG: hypothetical protein F9K24_14295 [Leptonema illini]